MVKINPGDGGGGNGNILPWLPLPAALQHESPHTHFIVGGGRWYLGGVWPLCVACMKEESSKERESPLA